MYGRNTKLFTICCYSAKLCVTRPHMKTHNFQIWNARAVSHLTGQSHHCWSLCNRAWGSQTMSWRAHWPPECQPCEVVGQSAGAFLLPCLALESRTPFEFELKETNKTKQNKKRGGGRDETRWDENKTIITRPNTADKGTRKTRRQRRGNAIRNTKISTSQSQGSR